MNSNINFFSDDKGAAAVLKHGVLSRYAAKFMAKTSSTSPSFRVGVLDGYAGQGEYVNPISGLTSEGSPVILLRIAKDLAERGRQPDLVFVEKDKNAFATLESVIAKSGYPYAQALRGDVETHLAAALSAFAEMPALVFLDPFGTSLDHASMVERVLKRPGTQATELLLNFSLQALRRMGARLWEAEGASGRAKTLERVDHWLGGDWWRAYFLDPEVLMLPRTDRAHTAATRVALAHARRIHEATGCGYFAVPIRRKPQDKPLFLLTLFHPRRLALYDFNEAVSMALKDWRAFLHDLELAEAEVLDAVDPQLTSRVGDLQSIYKMDEAQIDRDAVDDIKDAIASALETRTSLSIRNDFLKVMGEGIGVGRTTHLRTAWKELAAEGVVSACPTGKLETGIIYRGS